MEEEIILLNFWSFDNQKIIRFLLLRHCTFSAVRYAEG